jgi:hypothetical protein
MEANFIYKDFLPDISICDELIEYYQHSSDKKPGVCGANRLIDKEAKDSTDIRLEHNQNCNVVDNYLKQLQTVTEKYIELFPMCNNYSAWAIIHPFNLQHYLPEQGFKKWHTERACSSDIGSSRHLVFMTYLNDVTDGGETEFYHQNIKIKPQKGLTVIWPADWTYTHRGLVSNTQEKYIVTGWYNYFESPKNES